MIKTFDRIPLIKEPTAVALGYFDGVHLGHQLILKQAVESGLYPIAFTFKVEWGLPDNKKQITRIFPYSIRREKMSEIGISAIIEPEFIRIKNVQPKKFVDDILAKRFRAKLVLCGKDYRFGANASGDSNDLKALCEQAGIEARVSDHLKCLGSAISSTRIKDALKRGEISLASKMLGFNYFFKYMVVRGNKLGRQIGFPTINQKLQPGIFVPKLGVYSSITEVGTKLFPSITNIGTRPTTQIQSQPIAETHILNFAANLYDKKIKVILLDFIREEKQFSSLDELKKEIQENIKEASISHKNFNNI